MASREAWIDALKGAAILAVILLHSFPNFSQIPFFYLHIAQALPIFILLLGANYYNSFKERYDGKFIKYYFETLISKLIRFILPIFFLLIVLRKDLLNSLGCFIKSDYCYPIYGPGDYFILVLFQFILFSPILVWLFRKNWKATLTSAFLVNLAYELSYASLQVGVYHESIFRFIVLIVLGFWFSSEWYKKDLVKILAVFSMFYLLSLPFNNYLGGYIDRAESVFAAFYTLFLVATFKEKYDERKSDWLLLWLGRISYYLFLIQMVFFSEGV